MTESLAIYSVVTQEVRSSLRSMPYAGGTDSCWKILITLKMPGAAGLAIRSNGSANLPLRRADPATELHLEQALAEEVLRSISISVLEAKISK